MADFNKLSEDFIAELIKAALNNPKILGICRQHLKYQFLETEAQKKVLKYIFEFVNVSNVAPTVGMIGQTYPSDKEVISFLNKIKKSSVIKEAEQGILQTFEKFIKNRRFVVVHDKVAELYNEGKQEEAIEYLAQESDEIAKFKLKEHFYTTVFENFESRIEERRKKPKELKIKEKCPFGIHGLDDLLYGGAYKGTSACILARSGVGKTTFLRWIGIANARAGKRVVHFFAEGTEDEHKEAYDAAWTGITLRDMEYGDIPDDSMKKIMKARKAISAGGGEIIIIACEEFDSMSIDECKDIMLDIEENIGKIDVALFDYLEEFTVKGSYTNTEFSERKRRSDISKKITNIATKFKVFSCTATQANDIKFDKWNNENNVLTRSDISEYKGAIKPFSYFLTLNQTMDEYENQIVRIYCDKFRKFKSGQIIKIYQAREVGRFYDSTRTLETFYSKV